MTRTIVNDPDSPSRRLARALALEHEELRAALVQARLDAGLSQQDLADRLGLSQPTIAAFERYDNDPRLSTIRRYAHALGVMVSHDVHAPDTDASRGWVRAWRSVTPLARTAAPEDSVPTSSPRHLSVVRGVA